MDTNMEDKIVDQIEKSLKTGMEDQLFSIGRHSPAKVYEIPVEQNKTERDVESVRLSRAEYIRQAREACLRQLDTMPVTQRSASSYIPEVTPADSPLNTEGETKWYDRIFPKTDENEHKQETGDFRSLLIRTVFCVVIFLFVFAVDRLKIEWGSLSYTALRENITGKDILAALEQWIVSWIK